MSDLMIYESACAAVARAVNIDEVLEINARAEAVRAYAKQAKNRDLEIQAAEIRLRAVRRLGELINAIYADQRIEENTGKKLSPRRIKELLARDLGVSFQLARKALSAAGPTKEQHERLIAGWRARCVDENRVTMTLEPAESRHEQQERLIAAQRANPLPPAQRGPLDNFVLPLEKLNGGQSVGDLCVHSLEKEIEAYEVERDEMVWTITFLKAVKNHFGGGFQQRDGGPEILLRDVITNQRLEQIIKETNKRSRVVVREQTDEDTRDSWSRQYLHKYYFFNGDADA